MEEEEEDEVDDDGNDDDGAVESNTTGLLSPSKKSMSGTMAPLCTRYFDSIGDTEAKKERI